MRKQRCAAVGAQVRWSGYAYTQMQGRGGTGARGDVRSCEGEGALRRWRKFVGAETHIRQCIGVGTLVRIRMYANAGAQVRWGGYAYTPVQGCGYTGAEMDVR